MSISISISAGMQGVTTIALAALFTASCSGPPSSSSDGAVPFDQLPDRSIPSGPLAITVYRYDSPADLEPKVPLAGVTVALDRPGSALVEQTTDAQGKVTFKDVRWADGPVSCTAYAKGYVVRSVAGVTAAHKDLELTMLRRAPALVPITVTPLNMQSDATLLMVSASSGVKYYQEQGTPPGEGTLMVPPGEPFVLVGRLGRPGTFTNEREFSLVPLGWARADHPGTSSNATVNLDFATPLPSTTVKGTIVPPADAASPLVTRAWADVEVLSLAPLRDFRFGQAIEARLQQETGSFEYKAQFVRVADAPEPYTRYSLTVYWEPGETQRISSNVWVSGYPKADARVDNFLDLPYLTRPSSSTKPAPLHDEIRWTSSEPEAIPGIVIFLKQGYLWVVHTFPGATSITVPRLPSAAQADNVLENAVLDAQILLCREPQRESFDLCLRTAWGRPFKLLPR